LDQNIVGNAISRAAASGISGKGFELYFGGLVGMLLRGVSRHPKSIETRLAKAAERVRFK
jgi:hypothetical protein